MAKYRVSRVTQRGFTLIEVLFSLSICLLIILNTVPILKIINVKNNLEVVSSNYALGAKQIAWILYCSKDITVNQSLSFKNSKDESFTISLNNRRVVKEPGFDIIIHNVEDLNFYQQDKNIYMELSDGTYDYTYLVATNYQIEEVIEDEEDQIIEPSE